MPVAFFDTSLNVCTWTEAKRKVFCFIKMKLRAPFKHFKPVSSCTQHSEFQNISDYTGQQSHGDVMHHHNGPRPETSCILRPCCRTEESFCFKSCLSAVRMWCTTPSQDPPKNKSEKTEQECEERSVSAAFCPAGLSGRCEQLMCSFKRPAGSKGRRAWCTRQTTLDNGRICRHETRAVLVPAHRPRARNVPFSYVGGRRPKLKCWRHSHESSLIKTYLYL